MYKTHRSILQSTLRSILGLLTLATLLLCAGAMAQEATIRKVLAERLPQLPKIDEITRSPVAGLWEVRFGGSEILYSDEKGDFIIANGALIDTKTRTDLTSERLEKLMAIDFDDLPIKDALVIKQGNGARKLAVFGDPHCGYCKRLERDLAQLKDVTIYTFLIPILGPDSVSKSRDLWCAKDPMDAWRDWMLEAKVPAKAGKSCNSAAVERNLAFSRKHRINGTPALIFENGTRKPGAIPAAMLEQLLVTAAAKK